LQAIAFAGAIFYQQQHLWQERKTIIIGVLYIELVKIMVS
jgi:hypothetical protein